MKRLIFLVLFFSVSTTFAFAQFHFGDVEVSTMEEIFNPDNENLWGEKKMGGTYKFKDQNSEIWTENEFSGLIVNNKYVKQNSANFSASLKYEQSSLIERITKQLNEQFGEFEKVEFDNSALGGGKAEMLKWTYEEDDKIYEILLGKLGQFTSLNIRQLESVPDF
jgi:hypothetical protein